MLVRQTGNSKGTKSWTSETIKQEWRLQEEETLRTEKTNKEALLSPDSLKHHLLESWWKSPGRVAACCWKALENRVPGAATYKSVAA